MRLTHRIALGAVLLVCAGTAGCSYQKHFETGPNNYGTRQYSDHNNTYESRPNALFIQSAGNHDNRSVTYSRSASARVADMSGVREALVFVTDKNAYAAVLLDRTGTGLKGTGKVEISDNTITSNGFHRHSFDSKTLNPGVIVTDKYSNVVIPEHDGLSSEFQARAQAAILELHPGLQGIYISSNPHFINAMSMFAHTAWRNESLQPALGDFNRLVQDVFGRSGQ